VDALRLPGERLAGSAGVAAASPSEVWSGVSAGIADLERKVAQQSLELDFFRAALQHFADRRREADGSGGKRSTS
jgi:hypothetical protein